MLFHYSNKNPNYIRATEKFRPLPPLKKLLFSRENHNKSKCRVVDLMIKPLEDTHRKREGRRGESKYKKMKKMR